MASKNIFEGDSYQALFSTLIYQKLISRLSFTYVDVMREYDPKIRFDIVSITKCDHYGELKKAFLHVKALLEKEVGERCIEVLGNNRAKKYRYIGQDPDPLADMMNAKVISNLQEYWKFCQNSAGFFPKPWLEYFFKDCQDLLDMKTKRKKGLVYVSASVDRVLKNIDLLPVLYKAIENKQVLEIDYQPFDKPVRTLCFHPHFLKEYNGRWFLFGYNQDLNDKEGIDLSIYNLPLDRIQNTPTINKTTPYKAINPPKFYQTFFDDIVGVTHINNNSPIQVLVRSHSSGIHNLMLTKPLHPSQKESISFGNHDGEEYGEFTLHLALNKEFLGQILHYGSGLEIRGPQTAVEYMKEESDRIYEFYHSHKK